MSWLELKNNIRNLLLSRNLSNPNIRLNALNNLEELFKKYFPELLSNTKLFLNYDKKNFKAKLSKYKKLNSAEESIINNIYQFLDDNISIQENTKIQNTNVVVDDEETRYRINKLEPIADFLSKLLYEKFNRLPKYALEVKHDWLLNSPSKEVYCEKWDEIQQVYLDLVDKKLLLDDVLNDESNSINYGRQKVDIWFGDPYCFIVEFDETQHFNQYRLKTLNHYLDTKMFTFDLDLYKKICSLNFKIPGNSGFQKLKKKDPLFPNFFDGDKQDNRIRQRAFRDYLKDIAPILMGFNPTIRISYKTTNDKINNFLSRDLICVSNYLSKVNAFSKIKLKN